MIGSLFAGTDESPGETSCSRAAPSSVIAVWARLGAMQGGRSRDRYAQEATPYGFEIWCLKASKVASRIKAHCADDGHSACRRPESRHGLLRVRQHRDLSRPNAKFVRITSAASRKPCPRRHHHERSAELSAGVIGKPLVVCGQRVGRGQCSTGVRSLRPGTFEWVRPLALMLSALQQLLQVKLGQPDVAGELGHARSILSEATERSSAAYPTLSMERRAS